MIHLNKKINKEKLMNYLNCNYIKKKFTIQTIVNINNLIEKNIKLFLSYINPLYYYDEKLYRK